MDTATRWLRRLWRTGGSSRLAVILLAALLLTSLLASLFPQMPTGITGSAATRESWLAVAALRYGRATDLLQSLGLFDAYHTPWFLALLGTLLLNTLLCTIQRLSRLWRSFTQAPAIVRPEAFFQGSTHRTEWPVPSLQAGLGTAQDALASRRYAVYVEHDRQAHCANIYAQRGRWAQLGTLVSHTAMLMLVIAVVARPALGWQETAVTLLPDQVYAVRHQAGFSVHPGELVLDRYPDGQPRDYQVPLTVLVGDSPVLTQTVRLSHPLTFRGVTFHLQGYGPAARLATPESIHHLAFGSAGSHEVSLREAGLTLRTAYQPEADTLFVEALAADGSLLGSGSVTDGQEIEIQGIPITFTLSHYTIWQVSHDPTFGPAIGLGGLLLMAVLVSLWVPHRRIWLRVDEQRAQMVTAAAGRDLEALAGDLTAQSRGVHETSEFSEGEGDG